MNPFHEPYEGEPLAVFPVSETVREVGDWSRGKAKPRTIDLSGWNDTAEAYARKNAFFDAIRDRKLAEMWSNEDAA